MGRLIDSDRLLALIEGMKKSICYQENNTQIAINNIEGMIFSSPTVDKVEMLDDLPSVTPAPKKYNIACPYCAGDPRRECKNNKWDDPIDRNQCVDCKAKWLASEVDE